MKRHFSNKRRHFSALTPDNFEEIATSMEHDLYKMKQSAKSIIKEMKDDPDMFVDTGIVDIMEDFYENVNNASEDIASARMQSESHN